MQPDLQGMEITKEDLRNLTGQDPEAVVRDAEKKPNLLTIGAVSLGVFFVVLLCSSSIFVPSFRMPATLVVACTATATLLGLTNNFGNGGSIFSFVGIIAGLYAVSTLSFAPASLVVINVIISLLFAVITATVVKIIWSRNIKNNIPIHLLAFLKEVEKYNVFIKAISINDQLEAAGNPGLSIDNREKVIEVLKRTRADLVCALKTERILRENKDFIATNPELFANKLTTLTGVRFSDRASDHGRLLNEALQIAISAQEEMKQLQSQRSS